MTVAEMVEAVKNGTDWEGTNYNDTQINEYVNEVVFFAKSAGVPETVILSQAAVGLVRRGVLDLWNYSSGDVKFSEYFKQRLVQLAAGGV